MDGTTETFDELASALNAEGILSTRGTPYTGGRGVARLVHATYDHVLALGLGQDAADLVAYAFTNANGDYAHPA